MIRLLIDPDLLLPDAGDRAPQSLIRSLGPTRVVFGFYSADEASGPRCDRCNRLLHVHLWQAVNGVEVIDCEARS